MGNVSKGLSSGSEAAFSPLLAGVVGSTGRAAVLTLSRRGMIVVLGLFLLPHTREGTIPPLHPRDAAIKAVCRQG